ncbi:hypothetical protein ACJ41O_007281 [Fusarium nematophilum]
MEQKESQHLRPSSTAHARSKPSRQQVRCEGSQPTCKTCEVYHDDCRYDKAPPMSQVVALARRLQEAEKTIEDLRARGSKALSEEESTGDEAPNRYPPQPAKDTYSSPDPQEASDTQPGLASTGDGTPPPSHVVPAPWPDPLHNDAQDSPPQIVHHTPKEPPAAELSVDEHGKICYYGPTSAVHDPPQMDSPGSLVSTAHTAVSIKAEIRDSLSSYAKEMAIWEEFALGNASLQTGIPRNIMAKLLHLHWTWVSPMFMWVYRPAFIRDMATGGRYYSEFLLTVICAHAAKYQDGNCADFLLARARRLLGTAIQQPSSIPTIQALLQLSARDLAHGSISQAWVYSGIAFRMASDLGLQHSSKDVKGLSPVDLEIRRRLFWGCYFWDKYDTASTMDDGLGAKGLISVTRATSLYAGRLPAVTELLDPSSLDLADDSTEQDVWTPYYGDSLNLTRLTHDQYPSMKSHAVSCFVNSCKLSIIINDIIVQLYSRRSRTITEAALKDIKLRLDVWRAQSPAHLRYDPDHLPTICPPPHLISQNLLYFTSVILAHRPFWSVPAYYQVCISASQSIEKLVLLLESTFGLENITYLMGYCIYTGASAILEDAKGGSESAHATLRTFLRALNTGMRRCPLLERSLNIIVKGMNCAPARQSAVVDQMTEADAAMATNSYIPAFPYIDPALPIDFDMNPYLGGTNMDAMAGLDCYPELQLDLGELICPPLQ